MSTIDIPFGESRTPYWAVAQLQPSHTALAAPLVQGGSRPRHQKPRYALQHRTRPRAGLG
jgi:hypothetical protein